MPAALAISNLRFSYAGDDGGRALLDIASQKLEPGEQMLLTGGSGSGKSTLLHLIAGLLDVGPGSIVVNGTDIQALRGPARDLFRGRSIGMVFQTFNLLQGFSAAENVMLAMMFSAIPAREHRGRAVELLKTLGLSEPEKPVERMSVGQQQRVAVARAVACDPVLVLADEPTASLDPANAARAMQLLQDACRSKNAALLCVSHDPAMLTRFVKRAALDALTPDVEPPTTGPLPLQGVF
jgi:ABC-type lipoprotein export system ATPase subunit